MKENEFYAMLSRMKYINRWGLMRNTISENIKEHSLDVAMIAHGLCVIGNTYFNKSVNSERVALLAMYHDATEIITGDLPTPIKYFAPEIKNAYKEVESFAGMQLLNTLPKEMRDEYKSIVLMEEEKELLKYVKAADKISALIKCIEEIDMGNHDFVEAMKSTKEAVINMHMEEADYFLENFLPAYGKTIDEF